MSNQESGVRRYAAVSALALAIGLLTFTPEATDSVATAAAECVDTRRGSVGIGPT